MKIAIIGLNYSPEPTGIAPYTTKLAEALARVGHEVQVVTGYPHYPTWKRNEEYEGWRIVEEINGVRTTRLRHYIPSTASFSRRLHMELSFGLRALLAPGWVQSDLVLFVSPALFSVALPLMRAHLRANRPSTAIWVQDIYSRGLEETATSKHIVTRVVKSLEGKIFRLADGVAVIHDRFADYVGRSLKLSPSRIRVIRNWTHISSPPAFDRDAVRQKLAWRSDETIVLHAGNIGIKQGLSNVVKAAQLAEDRGSAVRFILLGDGNQRQHIQRLAQGVKNIDFIPPMSDDEFNITLRSADVLLVNELPGLREMAVPSKLTSYFSAGLPVLAATDKDSTTAGELSNSMAGLRVEPDSPIALVEAAERLAEDKELADKLGRAGVRYAASTLSQDAAIVQYGRWLQELAATRPVIRGTRE